MLRQIARPVMPIIRSQKRGLYSVPDTGPARMNDLPVPQGSWQDHYAKQQGSFYRQMAISGIFFVGTIVYGASSGLLYLNWGPPKAH